MSNYIRFDWAMKRLLRDKANFAVLEGLITTLLGEKMTIQKLLESESNQESEYDKHNRVDILAENTHGELFIIEIQNNYQVRGCTALLDAIAGAIHHIGNVHKYARPEDVPEHTIFIITTDGMENASCRYSAREIKEKIKRQTEKYGWEFIFLAANIDAVETADDLGIRRDRAANYRQTNRGVERSYYAMSEAISTVRMGCAEKMDLAEYLKDGEEND